MRSCGGVAWDTYLRLSRKVAPEPGALRARRGPVPATSTQGNPGREEGEKGLPTGRWPRGGQANTPAHHHQLLLRRLPAEAQPHVDGEQGAAAVEDGGQRAHEGGHDHSDHQAPQTWGETRSPWTTSWPFRLCQEPRRLQCPAG